MSEPKRLLPVRDDSIHCVLCHDAPCSKACAQCDPGRILRALRFDNIEIAADLLPEDYDPSWMAEAEAVCPTGVKIGDVLEKLKHKKQRLEGTAGAGKVDLACDLCGVKLENPFLLSSSVVASNYEMCAQAFEMGWAGAAFKTVSMMEMHEASPRFSAVRAPVGDWYGFKNIEQLSTYSVEENLEFFRRLKKDYPTKVIVASIMGRNEQEWEYLARAVTEAGADVIECNFSCPNMEAQGTGSDIGQDPDAVRRFTQAVRRGSSIPVLAKMTPNITDITVPAIAAVEGGADGIAAINTIKSITGVNLDTMTAQPSVHGQSMIGGYSGRAVKPIALRMISQLGQCERLQGSHISAMGGIVTWRDSVEFLMLGAQSLQVTTAVMEYGYRIIDDLISGLQVFMAQRNYRSIKEISRSGLENLVENDRLERDTIVFPSFDREKCIGCGRCYISCRDGGHQAISFDAETRKVTLHGSRCVGCQLCSLVCPVRAIRQTRRVSPRK
ncbi:MAG TPA: NAD-dependent dihydropyrimidine dehydrogenase subunit PreA [Lachnospiraceae bacterium]|nr:NAD-dependent dihydropyrimidine dehydrogenase subunit PreA [Lachnospiraceae bacterium]